jgi:hypothetical protein
MLQNRQRTQGEIVSCRLDGPNCPKSRVSVNWRLPGRLYLERSFSCRSTHVSDFVTPQKCPSLTPLTARPNYPKVRLELISI